jgi:uncharacterized circularly permuted ATP-grasp superfamily protein
MGDLFEDYEPGSAWDEMFDQDGDVRPGYAVLKGSLGALSIDELTERSALRDRFLRDQGITFSLSGEERPFPLDLLPRVITAEEWTVIEGGVAQRVRALEAFLADVYGERGILRDGVVPHPLVTSSQGFHRQAAGLEPANGVRVHVAGIDLLRAPDGRFVVLEDNIRTPSGISYVIENRRTMARVQSELFASHRVRPVADYPARLLEALLRCAPHGRGDPMVVVLTPGVYNAAYFEHSFLARQMGVELVEGRDLIARDNVVYMRTTDGDRRVDVVYRRIDDEYLDPLQFRPDSVVGCPGIVNAARAGNVTIANAPGNGVADDKAIYPFVPEMIDYYLKESPILGNVPTFRLDREDELEEAMSRMDELVWKPASASGGYGLVIGPRASKGEIDRLRSAVMTNPRAFIAQEVVDFSTSPTLAEARIEPRHIDLRPFAVNDGERVWVVPGGLTRVALPRGSLVVNSSQGGGSKDSWVLAGAESHVDRAAAPAAAPRLAVRGEAPSSGPIDGQQQQQQQ